MALSTRAVFKRPAALAPVQPKLKDAIRRTTSCTDAMRLAAGCTDALVGKKGSPARNLPAARRPFAPSCQAVGAQSGQGAKVPAPASASSAASTSGSAQASGSGSVSLEVDQAPAVAAASGRVEDAQTPSTAPAAPPPTPSALTNGAAANGAAASAAAAAAPAASSAAAGAAAGAAGAGLVVSQQLAELEVDIEVEVVTPASTNSAPASTNGSARASAALALQSEAEAAPEAAEAPLQFYEPELELLAAAKVIPHPAKVEKGGEDAYLISDVGAGVICVADGVGGWANDGVDPALYSKELIAHLQAALDAAECQEDLEPRGLLKMAHQATTAQGAATAVVAVFDGERGALQVANLGDSGVLVVRQGEVVFKTKSQQHFFDCPFQLGSESEDSAEDAEVYDFALQEGDAVVVASDGLLDNVFDKDVASILKIFGGKDQGSVQRSATAIAALAAKHSADPEYMSPYTLEALEQGLDVSFFDKLMGKKLSGGKPDDITVVVGQVVRAKASSKA